MNELDPDIYENIIIGNFLFGLGAAMQLRRKDKAMPLSSINLFQRTRYDESFADVLIRTPGVFRILEFKRAANKDPKERTKLWMLQTGLKSRAFCSATMARLTAVSREIHWYVETSNRKSTWNLEVFRDYIANRGSIRRSSFKVRIVPYLDFLTGNGYTDLAKFVEQTAEEASKRSIRDKDMKDYIQYLQLLCSCRGSGPSGGLLVSISAGGQVRYVPVDNIPDFLMTREKQLGTLLAIREKEALEMAQNRAEETKRRLGLSLRPDEKLNISIGIHR